MTQSHKIISNNAENQKTENLHPYFKSVMINHRIIDDAVVELIKCETIDPANGCVLAMHYIVRTNNYYGQKFNDLKTANDALEEGDMPTLFPPRESEMLDKNTDDEA